MVDVTFRGHHFASLLLSSLTTHLGSVVFDHHWIAAKSRYDQEASLTQPAIEYRVTIPGILPCRSIRMWFAPFALPFPIMVCLCPSHRPTYFEALDVRISICARSSCFSTLNWRSWVCLLGLGQDVSCMHYSQTRSGPARSE